MAVVALRTDRRTLIMAQPATVPAARGIETTCSLEQAMRFVDQTAIDTYVTAMGGTTTEWLAMTLP